MKKCATAYNTDYPDELQFENDVAREYVQLNCIWRTTLKQALACRENEQMATNYFKNFIISL